MPQKKKKKAIQRKFPYQLEFCPNPDVIQIHTRSRFPENTLYGFGLRYMINNRRSNNRKVHPFYLALAKIRGIEDASGKYTLQIEKARMFSWDRLLPKIIKVIQETIADKRSMILIGKPKRPSEEYLAVLRRDGCDV